MENASEALMMAFGVLIFVLALTVAINSFSQARSVSDEIIYMTDETNYYDYEETTGGASQSRIVGLETMIPTLYKYKKEDYIVLFREGEGYNEETGDFASVRPLTIYTTRKDYGTTKKVERKWNQDKGEYIKFINEKYGKFFKNFSGWDENNCYDIFGFDVLLEDKRNEPWTGSDASIKENIRCFLEGDTFIDPAYKNQEDGKMDTYKYYINYSNIFYTGSGGFIKWAKDKEFVETVGEYTYNSNQKNTEDGTEDASSVSSLVKQKKKRIIIYTWKKS